MDEQPPATCDCPGTRAHLSGYLHGRLWVRDRLDHPAEQLPVVDRLPDSTASPAFRGTPPTCPGRGLLAGLVAPGGGRELGEWRAMVAWQPVCEWPDFLHGLLDGIDETIAIMTARSATRP